MIANCRAVLYIQISARNNYAIDLKRGFAYWKSYYIFRLFYVGNANPKSQLKTAFGAQKT